MHKVGTELPAAMQPPPSAPPAHGRDSFAKRIGMGGEAAPAVLERQVQELKAQVAAPVDAMPVTLLQAGGAEAQVYAFASRALHHLSYLPQRLAAGELAGSGGSAAESACMHATGVVPEAALAGALSSDAATTAAGAQLLDAGLRSDVPGHEEVAAVEMSGMVVPDAPVARRRIQVMKGGEVVIRDYGSPDSELLAAARRLCAENGIVPQRIRVNGMVMWTASAEKTTGETGNGN